MPKEPSQDGNGRQKSIGRPKKEVTASTLSKQPDTPKTPLNKTEKKGLSLISDQTREAQILRYIIAGYSKQEIAEELQITVKTVANISSHVYDKVDKEVAEMQGNWIQISLMRTEVMMKKLMIDFTKKDHDIEKSDVDMLSKLVSLQSKILGYDNKSPNLAIQNNFYSPQLESNSDAYRYSLAQEQMIITGKTMKELESYVIPEDSPINKLDGLLDEPSHGNGEKGS